MKMIEEIYDEMKQQVQSMSGVAMSDSGDMAIRLRAFAYQVFSLQVQQEFVQRQMFPQTATGEFLDRHAQMRGLERRHAVKARGVIRFSINETVATDISVPAGQSCMTETGIEFVTTEAGKIAAGTLFCEVAAEAKTAGEWGNVPAGSIVYMMLAPGGVAACVNPEAFDGGVDEEGDEELRERVISGYRTLPNGANRAYYEKTALSCDGVAGVVVLPKNRGTGTVDVIISANDGLPSDSLIQTVSDRLDQDREICVDIAVLAPEKVAVDVAVSVEPENGYTFEDVSARVKSAVEELFDGSLLGESVLLAKLGSIVYSTQGVNNYRLTSPSADISAGDAQLPVLGTVSITQMGA